MNTTAVDAGLSLPLIRLIRDVRELAAIEQAAAGDNHYVVAPTHVVRRGGDVVGYGSLSAVPTLFLWVSTGRVRPRESVGLLNAAENIVAGHGARHIVLPCQRNSPFYPHLEKLGYTRIGDATLTIKVL